MVHELTMQAVQHVLHPIKAGDHPFRVVRLVCKDGILKENRINEPGWEDVAVAMPGEEWEAVVRWTWQEDRQVYTAGCIVTNGTDDWQEVTP